MPLCIKPLKTSVYLLSCLKKSSMMLLADLKARKSEFMPSRKPGAFSMASYLGPVALIWAELEMQPPFDQRCNSFTWRALGSRIPKEEVQLDLLFVTSGASMSSGVQEHYRQHPLRAPGCSGVHQSVDQSDLCVLSRHLFPKSSLTAHLNLYFFFFLN